MKTNLKIVLASSGRFHLLDLARELHLQGHDVKLHCALPPARAKKFGLPSECLISYFIPLLPLLVAERYSRGILRQYLQFFRTIVLDFLVSIFMKECDVFVGMSGLFVISPKIARKKFSSVIIAERASQHIRSQQKILSSINAGDVPISGMLERDLLSYDTADYVCVPSDVVKQSFINQDFSEKKIFQNPYGVDLNLFRPLYPTRKKKRDKPTAIFVGRWGLRKGADLTISLLDNNDFNLIQVGPVDDVQLPIGNDKFFNRGVVDQTELNEIYSEADFMILLSREEGLSLVQAQALASGLPVLCSQYTGGADLKSMIQCPDAIIEVDIHSSTSIDDGLKRIMEFCLKRSHSDHLGEKGRKNLSWTAYGERYSSFLGKITA